MQGRENSGESRVYLELTRNIYPGHCGYKSEVGGIMANLRDSTSNKKVRDYHQKFYRSENLCIIIAGCVKPDQVLRTLLPVEQKIISKGKCGDWSRPWQSPVPPLNQAVDQEILFPSDEEINGMVYIGWRGPPVTSDIYGLTACSILLKYLTDTPVSPLPREFVEIPDPYASKVSYSLVENAESLLTLQFENVPVDKLDKVRSKLESVFEAMLTSNEVFDMDRLETVINRHRLECLSHLENSPHDTIAYIIIGHMLYGNTTADLNQRLNIVEDLERMMREGQEFWIDLLRKYFVDGVSVTIRGRPSIAEQARLAKEEEDRVSERRRVLGEKGLQEFAQQIVKAVEVNEVPPPDDMLTCVPIPSPDSISFHKINAYTTTSDAQHPLFDMNSVPVYMQLDNLCTSFVYVFVLMDSSHIDVNLRRYLPLLTDLLLESPVERNGVIVPYDDIVAELERDTIAAGSYVGLETSSNRFKCGPYSSTVTLTLLVEPKKYEKSIDWLREILFQTKFTEERLKIIGSKIVNSVAEIKREGSKIVNDLMRAIRYKKDCNHRVTSLLHQYKFLTELLNGDSEMIKKALNDLEELRVSLTHPDNMIVHLAVNLDQLSAILLSSGSKSSNVASAWSRFLPDNYIPNKKPLKVTPDWKLLKNDPEDEVSCVAGIGAVESSFLSLTSPCLSDFNHCDLPAILVFFQYLTQLEGPLWKHIRGKGLAYSYSIVPRPNEAMLYLSLYKSSNVVGAFEQTKAVIEEKLRNNSVWDSNLYESAKSSVIFEIIHREKTIGDVVSQSLLSYFKGVSLEFNRDLVKRLSSVTLKDLERIGPKYISPLFDRNVARASVVCHPKRVKEVAKGLTELGLELTTFTSLEESFLNQ